MTEIISETPQGGPSSKEGNELLLSLLSFVNVAVANLKLLISVPILCGLVALAVVSAITPTFTATGKFLPPQQQQSLASSMLQSLGALGGLAGAASGLKNPTDQYIGFLKSDTVRNALIDRFELKSRYNQNYLIDTRGILDKKTRILAAKDGFITIEVDDSNPSFAASLTNAYVEELMKLLNRLAITEAQQRRVFFTKQLENSKNELTKAQQALTRSGVSISALNASPATALEGPARLRAQVVAQEVRMASMRTRLTENAPEYLQAKAEFTALSNQLQRAERAQPVPAAGDDEYISKYREYKYQEVLFELFSKQFEIAKLDEARDGAVVQVIDPAVAPEKKSKPFKSLIVLATVIFSEILLLIFLALRQHFLPLFKNTEVIKRWSEIRFPLLNR